ncbi:MAG: hypothetical protein J0G95_01890 [Rhizobiales bacterium]|nr:hypothetical protein [Hyphomicrobiales bacterium]
MRVSKDKGADDNDAPCSQGLSEHASVTCDVVMPGHRRSKNGVASLAYVPGIHALKANHQKKERGWPGERAFTPVFNGLCPAMTRNGLPSLRGAFAPKQSSKIEQPDWISSSASPPRNDIEL